MNLTLHVVHFLLQYLGAPHSMGRAIELANVAADIASTDATESEAELLAAICIHESRCHVAAVGDGGRARGPWQVHGRDGSAREALSRVRWSYQGCGDLSLFAGFGRCGGRPEVLESLIDPSRPRA
jgi:hypothetical protein